MFLLFADIIKSRMEELRQKLEFDSPQMQCQTLKKLCEQIKKRKRELVGESGVISHATPKVKRITETILHVYKTCNRMMQTGPSSEKRNVFGLNLIVFIKSVYIVPQVISLVNFEKHISVK